MIIGIGGFGVFAAGDGVAWCGVMWSDVRARGRAKVGSIGRWMDEDGLFRIG